MSDNETNIVTHRSAKLGIDFYLHELHTLDSAPSTLWFFIPRIIESHVVRDHEVPDDMTVVENTHTGMPFLKRKEIQFQ